MPQATEKNTDDLEFMNLRDVAAFTRLSIPTIERLHVNPHRGFPRPGYIGRRRIWSAEAVREWMNTTLDSSIAERGQAEWKKRG